jgi:hypothetical protein
MDVQKNSPATVSYDFDQALQRARADFLEMPGLRVTSAQARRLWMLDPNTCATVLSSLVASGFLSPSGNDAFVVRSNEPPVGRRDAAP